MDPVSVVKVLWHYKYITLVILLLTAGAGYYVYTETPKVFESKMTYAIVNPNVPTDGEIEKDPALALLNSDNPYLRSSDYSLILQVLVTKLNSDATVDLMGHQGLGTKFTVAQGGSQGPGLLVDITAEGKTPAQSVATTVALGDLLTKELYTAQKVNGADDTYLFTALVVQVPDRAKEQFSDRIRLVIIVAVAGFALLFAAISVARSIEAAVIRRRVRRADAAAQAGDDGTPPAKAARGRAASKSSPLPGIGTATGPTATAVSGVRPTKRPPARVGQSVIARSGGRPGEAQADDVQDKPQSGAGRFERPKPAPGKQIVAVGAGSSRDSSGSPGTDSGSAPG